MIYPWVAGSKTTPDIPAALETHDMATRPAKCCKACDCNPVAEPVPLSMKISPTQAAAFPASTP
jgi:hypothetical protein